MKWETKVRWWGNHLGEAIAVSPTARVPIEMGLIMVSPSIEEVDYFFLLIELNLINFKENS